MSRDPAKWGFFIWPSQKFTKFYKGKDLRLLELNKLEFLKSDLYFWNYKHLKFFNRIRPKNSWSFAAGTSADCHSFISEYFHSIFCSKVESSVLNKTTQKIFHRWPLNPG